MEAPIPDEECLILLNKNYFLEVSKVGPGPVMPTTADGAPFESPVNTTIQQQINLSDDRIKKKIQPQLGFELGTSRVYHLGHHHYKTLTSSRQLNLNLEASKPSYNESYRNEELYLHIISFSNSDPGALLMTQANGKQATTLKNQH